MVSVTRTKTTHRAKRAAAAARILEATERLLRDGERFTEISVERLLAEADVSRSTFYVHFADKSTLLIAVVDHAIDEVMQTAEKWWAADHTSTPDDAEATVRELIKVYRKHAPLLRTLAEVGAYDDQVADVWRAKRQRYADILSERVRREQSAGFVSADVDVDMAATAVGQLVDVMILEHVAHGSPRKDKQLAQTIARIGWLAYYGQVPER
jgi:TetR/AcrR family transcriptional regulator, ethionamide resistance regulator